MADPTTPLAASAVHLTLDPTKAQPPTRDAPANSQTQISLPEPKRSLTHPEGKHSGNENARIFFVGTATTILEWEGVRIMTDPNFLHAGDHVHLGPGVSATRQTNPAVDLHDLPRIDLVLLSHYHADHFDQLVEDSLRRDLPIISTPHAYEALAQNKAAGEAFTAVSALDTWASTLVHIAPPAPNPSEKAQARSKSLKVTAMPGKHVPPGPAHLLEKANTFLSAVPPTNGWMLELGEERGTGEFFCGYRIYISGDTLLVDDLKEIPARYPQVDLMLIHLGGTTVPGPNLPLLMLTMDAKQGVQLVHLIHPDVTIPIHYDDYDVFLSPLKDFKTEMDNAGLGQKVVYLDRGDAYSFHVKAL